MIGLPRKLLFVLALVAMPAMSWARGCLLAGTLIDTSAGSVPVESLQPGETIWAIQDGKRVPAKVEARYETTTESIITLHSAGHTLRVTPEHPIAIGPGLFRAAEFLEAGQTIEIWDANKLTQATIDRIEKTRDSLPAYNLLVLPGEDFLAAGILVHNKGCFLPDTPIEMADGSAKPIASIIPGDRLPAFTPDGKIVQTTVEHIITAQVDTYLNVWTEDRQLQVTPEHPFYIGHGTFQTIGTLHVGDAVYILQNGALTPEHIQRVETVHANITVYNLETADPNTFFAHGVAVHNKGCFPAGTKITTRDGETPIESLAAGDTVLAIDENGRPVSAKIQAIYHAQDIVWTLTTSAGTLRTTADHPLALWSGDFQETDEIALGSSLVHFSNHRLGPACLRSITQQKSPQTVYTLTVEGPHTFLADGFLVHNKGGGGHGGGGFGGGSHSSGGGFYFGSSHGSGHLFGTSTQPWHTGDWIDFFLSMLVPGLFVVIFLYKIYQVFTGSSSGSSSVFASSSSSDSDELDFIYPRNRIDHKSLRTQLLAEYLSKNSVPPDPLLMPDKITDIAKQAFTLLEQCWEARAYEPMRPLLTPDLFAQHQELLQEMVTQHEINRIENLRVLTVDLVHIECTGAGPTPNYHLTVLITASARDYYVDDRTSKFRRGDRAPSTFQEFWIFGRSGNRWLLSDIEQTKESDILSQENHVEGWTNDQLQSVYGGSTPDGSPTAIPSAAPPQDTSASRLRAALSVLAQDNLEWEPNHLLTRARTCYIALIAARQVRQTSLINRSCFGQNLITQLELECSNRQQEQRDVEYRNFCVRKTELVSIHPEDSGEGQQCVVRMIAHAQLVRSQNGKIISQDPYEKSFSELLTLSLSSEGWCLVEIHPA